MWWPSEYICWPTRLAKTMLATNDVGLPECALCQPTFAQVEFALQTSMDPVADSSRCAQKVEFVAFASNRIEQQSLHGQAGRALVGSASIGAARIDLRDPVFVLMKKVVVEVKVTLIVGRVFSLVEECDGGLQ